MTDALVVAIAEGDIDAFAEWMRGAERPLRLSLRRFATMVDTEAVLQETLLRVWQIAPKFVPDGQPNGLLRLAHRIARNLAVSEIRARGYEQEARDALARDSEAAIEFHPGSDPDPLLVRAVRACFDALPPAPRRALSARLENRGGQPDTVLAQTLTMTRNTFLQNITRARKALAQCLERSGISLGEAWR